MAKRKKQPEPIKYTGIPLPLNHPEIPDGWMPVDDYSSHRPLLYRAIMNTAHTTFFEFGMGIGSTPILKALYQSAPLRNHDLVSYENNAEWFERFYTDEYKNEDIEGGAGNAGNHYIGYYDNLLMLNIWKGSILFIDCAPAELRKELICKHAAQAKIIIVHDTEPGAEYVYGLADILKTFKFRCDLIVEGAPQTTVVSNLYEFDNWKTYVNDKIQFI